MDEPSEPSQASAFLPSTFLIGGGWGDPGVYEPFLRAATDAPGSTPRIACVILDEGEGDGERQFARYDEALRSAGDCTPYRYSCRSAPASTSRRQRTWTGCWSVVG